MENQTLEPLEQPMSDQDSDTVPQPISRSLKAVTDRLLAAPARGELVPADEERDRRREIVSRLLGQAGDGFKSHRMNNWTIDGQNKRKVWEAVNEWWLSFPERKLAREGLVLYGPVGTGKDHLAFGAVAAAVLEHGCTAAFRNGRELMAEVRDRIGKEQSEGGLIDKLTAPDVLILSDPLPVKGELTDFQADTLYRLIESRASMDRITVCTLNVANDAEADRRLGAATWDRLCDRAWKIACFWESYRKPAREIQP